MAQEEKPQEETSEEEVISITFRNTGKSKAGTYVKFVSEAGEHTPDFGTLYIKVDSPLADLDVLKLTAGE